MLVKILLIIFYQWANGAWVELSVKINEMKGLTQEYNFYSQNLFRTFLFWQFRFRGISIDARILFLVTKSINSYSSFLHLSNLLNLWKIKQEWRIKNYSRCLICACWSETIFTSLSLVKIFNFKNFRIDYFFADDLCNPVTLLDIERQVGMIE